MIQALSVFTEGFHWFGQYRSRRIASSVLTFYALILFVYLHILSFRETEINQYCSGWRPVAGVERPCICGYGIGLVLLDFIDMINHNDIHYNDVIMGAIASQITNLTIVYSIVYSDADQRKHQSSESLAFVRGIHRGPVTGDRWILRTNGQLRGNCLHLMTSSWLGQLILDPCKTVPFQLCYHLEILLTNLLRTFV